MRFCVFLLVAMIPTPVFAHWGHLGDVAGHSHWIVAGAAVVAVVLAAKLAAAKKAEAEEAASEDNDATTEEGHAA